MIDDPGFINEMNRLKLSNENINYIFEKGNKDFLEFKCITHLLIDNETFTPGLVYNNPDLCWIYYYLDALLF
jgi:hypothetical protein